MKKIYLLVILILAIPLVQKAQDNVGIKFEQRMSWNDVFDKAKREHKFVFVDAYTTWCGPCKMMDRDVFSDQSLGTFMNDLFVSVKVQMDSVANDSHDSKDCYKNAQEIRKSVTIDAYPCLLFYSADGRLLHKSIGFKNVNAFTSLARFAGDTNSVAQFEKQLSEYKNGKKNYSQMVQLSRTVREISGDLKLASKIASDYKKNYLDKLPRQQFLTKDNIEFIQENGMELLTVNDIFFDACYNNAKVVDSLMPEGTAARFMMASIYKDEIDTKLYQDNKPINNKPDWESIYNKLRSYTKINADEVLLNAKLGFYRKIQDWDTYTRLKSKQIKKYPIKAIDMNVFMNLNKPAWDVFLHCKSKKSLERALQWSELSIKLEMNNQYLDTKANILYKLGKVKKAIKLQELAFEMDAKEARQTGKPYILAYFGENLNKMKAGLQTW